MMMAMTQAKIGRSMKNLAIMAYFFSSAGFAAGAGAAGIRPAGARVWRRRRRGSSGAPGVQGTALTGAGPRLLQAVDDDLLATLQPGVDDEIAAGHGAGLDRARRNLAFGIDRHHELTLGATLHRALRYADRVVDLGLGEAHANEGAGQKIATRVGEFGAQDYRTGIGVDRQIGELEASLFR
jgi:hypothetical protein